MILLSEVVHAEKRLDSYIDDVYKLNALKILLEDYPKRKRYMVALNILIIKGSLKSSNFSRNISFRAVVVLILLYIRNYILWLLALAAGSSIGTYLLVQNGYVERPYAASIIIYPLFLAICIAVMKNIYDVTKIMDNRVVELEVNLSVGSEPINVMIASDLAYDLVSDYTDEAIYQSYTKESLKDYFKAIEEELNVFLDNKNLKLLFDSGGRHFQLAGLVSIMSNLYSRITTSSNPMIAHAIDDALKLYDSPQREINTNLENIINNWVDKSIYMIDEIYSLPIEQIILMLLFCKDKLLKLKEQYSVYDRI